MDRIRLTNANGLVVVVAPLGATITEVHVPDRDGRLADVVHAFDGVPDDAEARSYLGATIGRVANRIAGGRFELDGEVHVLAVNDPSTGSHLHGGRRGWDRALWNVSALEGSSALELGHVSPDGDEGYPGTVTAAVRFELTDDDELRVEMRATTDRPTLVAMAHHGYWNLGGTGSGTIADHELTLFASHRAPGMPPSTAEARPVAGTPFDFTSPRRIGPWLEQAGGDPPGFDHAFLVDGEPHQLRPVARLADPRSGRVMTLSADQRSVQLYTGNLLDGSTRGKGAVHARHSALCLESQAVPNAVHIPAWRGDVVLRAGETYRHRMVFRFSAAAG